MDQNTVIAQLLAMTLDIDRAVAKAKRAIVTLVNLNAEFVTTLEIIDRLDIGSSKYRY